ncbi:hypothetical protein BGZ60DRAFT_417691 [Tricladium varicosporioides]|nr:hypothetical protein BGZ60DRAFT_417691 [Hymenoscyphus varicosporioides]
MPEGPRSKGWSEAEKYSLMLQIICQLGGAGDKFPNIKFTEIDLPGRTPKAMSHAWQNIKAEALAFKKNEDGAPAAPATPKKRAAPKGDATPRSATKKAKATPKKEKRAKESDDEADLPDLGDTSQEDLKGISDEDVYEEIEAQLH